LPSTEVRQFAREISVRARELVSGMDEIVWAINPRYDTLKSSVAYFSQYAERLLKPGGIRCRIEVQPNLTEFPLSSEQRHNFFLGFKESLTNVLKHARAREVHISARLDGNNFVFCVADDGIGFAAIPQGEAQDGLINLQERIAKIGGHCEISSEIGRGTKLIFRLPLHGKTNRNR
jgi:signal transduction histidine kinase